MKIGANLQSVLVERGVTPEELCDALGWDQDTVAQVLSDQLSPRISELLRLATLLGVGISRLLSGTEGPVRKALRTRKGERVGVTRKSFLHYESLAHSFAGRKLEPFVIDLNRGSAMEPEVSRHPGEEFLFVLSGELQVTVDGEPYRLEEGDAFYFDSQLPHSLLSLSETSRIIAVIYNESMLQLARGHGMKSLIEAAKLLDPQRVVLVSPDAVSLSAVNRGIEEGVIELAYLVGERGRIRERCGDEFLFEKRYRLVEVPCAGDCFETEAARLGVELIRSGRGSMLMKGSLNTAPFMKAALHKEGGIGTGRRLSIVSVFELPGVDRLIFLTDPAINPELFPHQDPEAGIDIIDNAIDVARALGVKCPKVALLEANEVPSSNLPATLLERTLAGRPWSCAEVSGPLSYDLALYPEAAVKKGMTADPVAGKADILVVPHISGGNFLYKSWTFTLGAEVANIVIGATAPIILTSRSDSDLTKFLTICAGALYSHFLRRNAPAAVG